MEHAEFIERVQTRAKLSTGDLALVATKATLETWGERLEREQQRNLAAELPAGIAEYLLRREETTRFLVKDFYKRVAARAEIRVPEAIEQAQVVTDVLQEAISAGLLDEIRSGLPDEYDELFTGRPYGPGSPSA